MPVVSRRQLHNLYQPFLLSDGAFSNSNLISSVGAVLFMSVDQPKMTSTGAVLFLQNES